MNGWRYMLIIFATFAVSGVMWIPLWLLDDRYRKGKFRILLWSLGFLWLVLPSFHAILGRIKPGIEDRITDIQRVIVSFGTMVILWMIYELVVVRLTLKIFKGSPKEPG